MNISLLVEFEVLLSLFWSLESIIFLKEQDGILCNNSESSDEDVSTSEYYCESEEIWRSLIK
jgi:hypothetical protein